MNQRVTAILRDWRCDLLGDAGTTARTPEQVAAEIDALMRAECDGCVRLRSAKDKCGMLAREVVERREEVKALTALHESDHAQMDALSKH